MGPVAASRAQSGGRHARGPGFWNWLALWQHSAILGHFSALQNPRGAKVQCEVARATQGGSHSWALHAHLGHENAPALLGLPGWSPTSGRGCCARPTRLRKERRQVVTVPMPGLHSDAPERMTAGPGGAPTERSRSQVQRLLQIQPPGRGGEKHPSTADRDLSWQDGAQAAAALRGVVRRPRWGDGGGGAR